jgi:hypothetical protein
VKSGKRLLVEAVMIEGIQFNRLQMGDILLLEVPRPMEQVAMMHGSSK